MRAPSARGRPCRAVPGGTHDELIARRGRYYQLYTGNQIEAEE